MRMSVAIQPIEKILKDEELGYEQIEQYKDGVVVWYNETRNYPTGIIKAIEKNGNFVYKGNFDINNVSSSSMRHGLKFEKYKD